MKKFLLVAILIFAPSISFAQIIWQKAAKGMSVEQVSRVFPDAIKFEANEGMMQGDGAMPLLKIPNYEINQLYFTVYFYFKGGKLIQVTLEANPDQNHGAAYERMLQIFKAKYGAEFNESGYGLGVQKYWITKEKTKITLSYLMGELRIFYSSREKVELDKI